MEKVTLPSDVTPAKCDTTAFVQHDHGAEIQVTEGSRMGQNFDFIFDSAYNKHSFE